MTTTTQHRVILRSNHIPGGSTFLLLFHSVETVKVADSSNCPVIISGGVSSIEDIKKAKELNNKNIEGIIVGKAIYDGDINLEQLVREIDA